MTYETGLMLVLTVLPFFCLILSFIFEKRNEAIQTLLVLMSMFFMLGPLAMGIELLEVNDVGGNLDNALFPIQGVFMGFLIMAIFIFLYIFITFMINVLKIWLSKDTGHPLDAGVSDGRE